MKKILALLLAVTMILTMASCGGKKNTPEDSSPSQSTDQTKCILLPLVLPTPG